MVAVGAIGTYGTKFTHWRFGCGVMVRISGAWLGVGVAWRMRWSAMVDGECEMWEWWWWWWLGWWYGTIRQLVVVVELCLVMSGNIGSFTINMVYYLWLQIPLPFKVRQST
jgi:hypothetical protein